MGWMNQVCLRLAENVFPKALWRVKESGDDKNIYLTFDDGPHPEITPWVLELLQQYKAKATFFCVGKRAIAYPTILKQISDEGHLIGSHTFNHAHGWKLNFKQYSDEVNKGNKVLNSKLFRPPYGKITWRSYRWLSQNYKLVMWSLLSKDYLINKEPAYCINRVVSNMKAGDIVVFHDSEKAKKNLVTALPVILEQMQLKGFQFKLLPQEPIARV